MNEELKTFLILKHGSIERMYNLWLRDIIPELTVPEKEIITAHLDETSSFLDQRLRR